MEPPTDNDKTKDSNHLIPLDDWRLSFSNVSRSGIIDVLVVDDEDGQSQQEQQKQLGVCHIVQNTGLSWITETMRGHMYFAYNSISGFLAVNLAIDMLNKGDGSVIPEVEGLPDRCPIRFTAEMMDSSHSAPYTTRHIAAALARDSSKNASEREICAFLGATRSSTSMPMAILTGLAGRPQLSPWSTSSQLDLKESYPYFGRLITSEVGLVVPLILYLKERNVKHLGVIHWNDDYSNSYVRSLLAKASEIYPELTIVATDIPDRNAKEEDYANAIDVLTRTQFRWFFALFAPASSFEPTMKHAVERGIAGTGKHVWLLNSAAAATHFGNLVVEKDSLIAKTGLGVASFSAQNGRPGQPVFDKFVERLEALNNQQDLDVVTARMPQSYDDFPDFEPRVANATAFDQDPSIFASTLFDETIMLGLTACKAVTTVEASDGSRIHVDGDTMFKFILNTTFEGATGHIALEPDSGSREPTTAMFRMTNVAETVPFNETHVTFRLVDSDVFRDGHWVQETPYIYNDGTPTVPADVPEVEMNYNYLGTPLRAVGLTLASLVMLLSVGFAVWTTANRNERIIQASQPIFLLILCVGAFVMGTTIIPASIDDEIASERGNDISCMFIPWLSSIGFSLIFAALFSKTYRVNRIFNNSSHRRLKLTAWDVMTPMLVLIVCNVIVLSLWTALSPLVWTREVIAVDVFDQAIESIGYCTSDNALPYAILLVLFNLGALAFATYQSYLARGIATEFAESDYIARALVCILLVSFVGVPTMIIVSDDPRGRYFAMVCIIFVVCAAVLLFIFVPKLIMAKKPASSLKGAVRRSLAKNAGKSGTANYGGNRHGSGSVPITEPGSSEDIHSSSSMGIAILNSPDDLMRMKQELERLGRRNEELEQYVDELKELLQRTSVPTPSMRTKLPSTASTDVSKDTIQEEMSDHMVIESNKEPEAAFEEQARDSNKELQASLGEQPGEFPRPNQDLNEVAEQGRDPCDNQDSNEELDA